MPITTMQLRVSRQSGDNVQFIIIQASGRTIDPDRYGRGKKVYANPIV